MKSQLRRQSGRGPFRGRHGAWLPGAAMLLLALLAANMAGRLHEGRAAAQAVNAPAPAHLMIGQRSFYVTLAAVHGDAALDSCTEGYHMANLFEMHNVSSLRYAIENPEAKTLADQGMGPVVGWWGWARTGSAGSALNIAGRANCNLWTSAAAGEYGTLVRLSLDWSGPATAITPWQAQTWACSGLAPVWCVSDGRWGLFLPGWWGG